MISNGLRAAYYALTAPLMRANGALYRAIRAPRSGYHKVHLGPGQRNYLDGWINVDANIVSAKLDIWADLRHPLPFRDNTVDVLYSHHVIEHLGSMDRHFHEAFRVLKPGGVYRVAGPDGDNAIEMFRQNRMDWFSHNPEPRTSIGGRLDNFIMCARDHYAILTRSFVQELLENAGFVNVTVQEPIRKSSRPDLFGEAMATEFEVDFEHTHTLVLEAEKPAAA